MPPRTLHAEFPQSPVESPRAALRRGRIGLIAVWTVIGVVWCMALPGIAERPAVARRLRELDEQGIDASAMFYSELPAMERVLSDLDRLHRRNPGALWKP